MNHEKAASCVPLENVNGSANEPPSLTASPLAPDSRLPYLVTPLDQRPLHDYRTAARRYAETLLPTCGGLLFRGLPIKSAGDFESFIGAFTSSLVSYEFGSTPRSHVQRQVYTSTEYPPHQHIPLHNEQAYTREWPMKIWFYCGQPAEQGGYTPIADSREVYRRIPARVRERFVQKQIMYVRNYGNGLDVPWQKVFNTQDPAVVERYCRDNGIHYEWKADGELRTRQVAQAIAVHPRTGETVWFNQAHLFHVSNLEPAVRETLLEVVSEEDLPRNACYGDGNPIEADLLEEIRDVYRSLAVQFAWQQGDVMMLDNMLAAHGRTPFRGRRQILVAMAEPTRGAETPC
ncbi:MAG: Dapdiamide synthesis protein DdaC [Nitrospira sp.]|nr:MAG: Dapdiamide synthesis protein DdaC [Nitrospira sp.]